MPSSGNREPEDLEPHDRGAEAVVTPHSVRSALLETEVDPDWLESIRIDGSAYALPPAIQESLRRDRRLQKAADILEPEAAFWTACQAHRAVGFSDSEPVGYPFLAGMATPLASSSAATAGWPAESRHALLVGENKVLEVRDRLKGYLGWLVTEPAFLAELKSLRTAWRQFPAGQAPRLPFRRAPLALQPIPETQPAAEPMSAFLTSVDAILKRWSLVGLITWELPEPVGPQYPNPLPLHTSAVDHAVVHIVLPAHYPLQGNDALLAEIREHQRTLAEDQGIPDPVSSMSHYLAYGQMFEVAFWEGVLRHRFRALRLKGFVTAMEAAIATQLGISVAQTQKHRKAITACQAGRRHSVPHLKPKG